MDAGRSKDGCYGCLDELRFTKMTKAPLAKVQSPIISPCFLSPFFAQVYTSISQGPELFLQKKLLVDDLLYTLLLQWHHGAMTGALYWDVQ